jgi:hypothetical protein
MTFLDLVMDAKSDQIAPPQPSRSTACLRAGRSCWFRPRRV